MRAQSLLWRKLNNNHPLKITKKVEIGAVLAPICAFTTIRLADFPLFTIRHYLPIPFGVISMNRYYYLVGAYAPLDLMVTIACLVR